MQQSTWQKIPIVRILLAFASGIGCAMFYSFVIWYVALFFVFTLLLFSVLPRLLPSYQQRWVSGMAGFLLFFTGGILVHHLQNPLLKSTHFSHVPAPTHYLIKIDEEPIEKSHSYKMRVEVLSCKTRDTHVPTSGLLLLYLNKIPDQPLPKYGEVYIINAAEVREVPPPKNPHEFNYKRYLAFNHIHYQAYLKPHKLYPTGIERANTFYAYIYHIQHYFKHILNQYINSATEVGVAQALLYGFDDDIDEDTMSAYANTGTLHVLAVSGMHVGIIFYILNALFFFLNKHKRGLLVKRLLIIGCLWIYSALCGLSPSILRATVMFTFIIMADILERRSNIYNTLAASCFTLLCVDANMLANVGFQLSYMAVLGIVFIQPYLYAWWVAPNWLMDQIWKITSVSIAAQLATSPIGILYFHQFPNCFLFSNLLIIPLTTLVLYGCLVLLVVAKLSVLAAPLGIAIKYIISFTNWLVVKVEHIPYAYVNGLQISIFQSILMYVLVLCLLLYFMHRYTWLFGVALVALLYFVSINAYQHITLSGQNQLWVYSVNRLNAIQLIEGKKSMLLIDSAFKADKQKFRFHLQQHIWQNELIRVDTVLTTQQWTCLSVGKQHILLTGKEKPTWIKSEIDVLIVRNPVREEWIKYLKPQMVVLTGTLSTGAARRLEAWLIKNQINRHNVTKSGAFKLSLQHE